ncbi:MAG: hypothetical protein ABR512_15500 [Desulfopila sp.]
MMKSRNSLTVIQLNDSHAYFDLHQEMFWQGAQAVYRPAGGYARIAAVESKFGPQTPSAYSFAIAAIRSTAPIRPRVRRERQWFLF